MDKVYVVTGGGSISAGFGAAGAKPDRRPKITENR